MPQLTLKQADVVALAKFATDHSVAKWFLAKDEGAYVGMTAQVDGKLERIIHYFKGMDPSKEKYAGEAGDNARHAFGGDDFGEHFEASMLIKLAADETLVSMTVAVSATSIRIKTKHRKAKPAADKLTVTAPPKNLTGMTKGEKIRQLLSEGVALDVIVKEVGTTLNSVRWHKSKMASA